MPLEDELLLWDRKSKQAILSLYERYHARSGFLAALAGMLDDTQLQSGATWLLKHYFDNGSQSLDESLVALIYSKVPGLVHWDAKLHVLQCMSHMPVPAAEMRTVEAFVRSALSDDVKFVRAWAYSGFCELARRFPEFQKEAQQVLNAALESESAGSILSRIRRELRTGF